MRSSVSRAANTIATRSASRRLVANSSASVEAESSQCASSTTHTTGCSSAASVSIDKVATATRNGSTAPDLLPERDPERVRLRFR